MIFLNSASSAAALVFYLPGVCTHTDTEGKQRKARVRNNFKNSEKTQYLMNTVYLTNNLLLLKLRIMWQINCVGPPFTDNQPRLYQSHINVFLCVRTSITPKVMVVGKKKLACICASCIDHTYAKKKSLKSG